jgi:hypothetical protein
MFDRDESESEAGTHPGRATRAGQQSKTVQLQLVEGIGHFGKRSLDVG